MEITGKNIDSNSGPPRLGTKAIKTLFDSTVGLMTLLSRYTSKYVYNDTARESETSAAIQVARFLILTKLGSTAKDYNGTLKTYTCHRMWIIKDGKNLAEVTNSVCKLKTTAFKDQRIQFR